MTVLLQAALRIAASIVVGANCVPAAAGFPPGDTYILIHSTGP